MVRSDPRRFVPSHWLPLAISGGTMALGFLVGSTLSIVGLTSPGSLGPESASVPRQLDLFHLVANNGSIAAFLVGGGLLLGVPTVLLLFQNGLVLGLLAGGAASEGEIGVFLAVTVPHAVFELGGFVLAGTAGLVVPVELTRYLLGRRSSVLDAAAGRTILWCAGLAFVAVGLGAIVESTVTEAVARGLA